MTKYVTIGYGDRTGYDTTDQSLLDAAHAHDQSLVEAGVTMGMAGTPVQVRNHDGAGVRTEEGPFLTSGLPIAGFSLIEADSLEEAVAMVAQSPCAVAQGVIEVWPLQTS